MGDSLADFLRARLDEDERYAQRATLDPTAVAAAINHSVACYSGDILFAGRFTPARVLAEVAAKRAVLDLHRPWREDEDDVKYGAGTLTAGECYECGGVRWPCPTVRVLTWPYADRPAYDAMWKP